MSLNTANLLAETPMSGTALRHLCLVLHCSFSYVKCPPKMGGHMRGQRPLQEHIQLPKSKSLAGAQCAISKAKSPFWETYVAYVNNITYALSAPWFGRPPWCGDSIAVRIKQMWYVGNVTMTSISVVAGIRNLSQ